ncbi:PLP-dependent aminotransferase NCgl2355 [Halarchaeum acidiphilum MH1-52-1]|uniref:PLP-dependent aminotransferase NCgl2355 n=1 Tax=Halarchaeum acidiphilum MH1-52-1 TaxID=1261545 RepID=U3A2I4_9EURY|nr:aminotransferase class III-fold pyridoxal phosphate-dependent enzyme [Halarchaeum acidiphilum]GAD51844.1 PLP-dependent aminotransferase NCgl2355 [Halarchaeum acidiphilum MH1-52-1]
MGNAAIPHWYEPKHEPDTFVEGEGARVYNDEGEEYLDFVSQLYCVNAGHSQQHIVDAMTEQAEKIPYVSSGSRNPQRDRLARRLTEKAPPNMSNVVFSISGSEANETAMQIVRDYQDAPKILTRWRSYHGATYGAGALTGEPSTRTVLEKHSAASGHAKFLPPLDFCGPFDADTPEELGEQAADHLEWVIRNEGPDSIAALFTEPIAGSSGAYPAPPGYFDRVREICDEHDILLVADEVITGFGRCGEWFGVQTEDLQPDVITFAKGVTSSYAPLAGAIVSEELGDYLEREGLPVGQTFAGHPVSCAAANAAMDVYGDGLIRNVRDLEGHLESHLRELEEFPKVAEVRGRGFLWSVDFGDPDAEDNAFLFDPRVDEGDNPIETLREHAHDRGVVFGAGRPDTQVLICPPLCATREEIDEAVDVLAESIDATF